MSHQATAWVSEIRVGDPTLKSLLYAIAHRADRETWSCWPSLAALAYDTEVSKRTIQRRIDDLEKLGFIRVEMRRRPDGTQDNSLITITGGQIVTLSPPVDRNGLTGGQKVGVPVDTAVHLNKQEEQEEQEHGACKPKAQKDAGYSEEFEALWLQYPRTRNTAKKKAWDLYRMLNSENLKKVHAAVPLFAAAMKAEARPEDKIAHMTTWLNGRMYETVGPAAGASGAPTKTYRDATREDWQKVLNQWSSTNSWRESWGPEPGKKGCAVPEDMIAAHNVKHRGFMFSDEEIEQFKKVVASHSRDAGDAGDAAV